MTCLARRIYLIDIDNAYFFVLLRCFFRAKSTHRSVINRNGKLDLNISFSPDNTACTCNPGKAEMLKGIGQEFHQFARLPCKVL